MEYPGEVISRYEPPPRRVRSLRGRTAMTRRTARLRIRLEGGFTFPMPEPSGERFAVGDPVVVSGPVDLTTKGGQVSLRHADS